MKFSVKTYEWQILQKVTHRNLNQHITTHPYIRSCQILLKFAQNYINDKVLENSLLKF